MLVSLSVFRGARPGVASHLLRVQDAQAAVDCDLADGALRPLQADLPVRVCSLDGEIRSLFRAGGTWLEFGTQAHVVRGPVAGGTSRWYISGGGGAPRMTTEALAPDTVLAGVPQPGQTPSAAPQGHWAATTAVSQGATGYPATHNGYVYECTTAGNTGASEPTWPTVAGQTVNDGTAVWTCRGAVEIVSRNYVTTLVRSWTDGLAEEGPASAPSATFDAALGQAVEVTGLPEEPEGDYLPESGAAWKMRLYRAETGGTGEAVYRFVTELALPQTDHEDALAGTELGETLQSATWFPPPSDLAGLCAVAGGILAGFSGNEICFSEPFRPHAWPPEYRQAIQDVPVALGAVGALLVIAGLERPWRCTGSHPAHFIPAPLPDPQGCVAARGLASCELGVIFPTQDGLYLVGSSSATLLTAGLHSKASWRAVYPATQHAAVWDGWYIGYYASSTDNAGLPSGRGYALSLRDNEAGLVSLTGYADCLLAVADEDALYMVRRGGARRGTVYKHRGDLSTRSSLTWRSARMDLGGLANMAFVRVWADWPVNMTAAELAALEAERSEAVAAREALLGAGLGGSLGGAMVGGVSLAGSNLPPVPDVPGASLTVRVLVDGVERAVRQFRSWQDVRAIPAGYKGRVLEVEISGNVPVRRVDVATSRAELAGGAA